MCVCVHGVVMRVMGVAVLHCMCSAVFVGSELCYAVLSDHAPPLPKNTNRTLCTMC